MKKIFLLYLILPSIVIAQNFEFQESIGKFNKASSFYITANGLIYISDIGTDEVYLLDTLGNQLKTCGGYGWDDNSFDQPVDVFADPLSIYVADKNNHAIKRFDKNLNYLSKLHKRDSDLSEERFGYPLSCATSNQGDLYLIDSENKRTMKFDIFGNYKINFGGFDAGIYQLSNPLQLAISAKNNIFIIDGQDVIIFDDFGNGINKISLDKNLKSIRILFDQLVICTSEEIYNTYLKSTEMKLNKINLEDFILNKPIVSAILLNKKLYVLTQNEILVFNFAS
ncbi:MAG TPA: hypothetical protein DHV28_18335 [Ignavibacteriales bacterium]|nr:hypothetical protein [Ignavibacteriales bacterium]